MYLCLELLKSIWFSVFHDDKDPLLKSLEKGIKGRKNTLMYLLYCKRNREIEG